MELLDFLELILGIGINPIEIIRILRINSRILRIPRIPETELPGNAGQERTPRILLFQLDSFQFLKLTLSIPIIPIGISQTLRIVLRI